MLFRSRDPKFCWPWGILNGADLRDRVINARVEYACVSLRVDYASRRLRRHNHVRQIACEASFFFFVGVGSEFDGRGWTHRLEIRKK